MPENRLLGWEEVDPSNWIHHCGARISRRKTGRWTVRTVSGALKAGFLDSQSASNWLQTNDPDFWSIGELGSFGIFADILLVSGCFDKDSDEVLNVCSVAEGEEIPEQYRATFKRLFLQKAICAKCGSRPTAIKLRRLAFVEREVEYRNHVVCDCGHPVWRMSSDDSFSADRGLARAESSWQRKTNLSVAGGTHVRKEIEEIRSLQQNRCIYCNVLFSDTRPLMKDHLLPVSAGGPDWALNLVLACRSCNSRRCDIPFRTYCKLLSKAQNQRIVLRLGRRISTWNLDEIPDDAFSAFCRGIALHDPAHPRYKLILSMSATARKNASDNRVIPGKPHLLLRKAFG